MKKYFIIALTFFNLTLSAGIPIDHEYHGPTEQLIKRDSWKKIQKGLKKKKVPSNLYPFFNEIAQAEDWGHIGYHGANQGFRVYQDVIRFTVEEILGISIRDDFHFLRTPGDPFLNLNSFEEFCAYHGRNHIDNRTRMRAQQLLSLNYGIYSNYNSKNSCSLEFFVKDKSRTSIDYSECLSWFYQELGISKKELNRLFDIGRKWLDEDGGILLQISESSHIDYQELEAYNFADNHCYPCKSGGYRYGEYPISNHYERIETDLYIQRKLDCSPQLRLLMNNRYTLNPYSYLSIRRFDLYDEKTVASYEKELREAIRSLKRDNKKVESFKKKLLDMWQ